MTMSDIHVYTADGALTVLPEERVVELLHSGELAPEALYWRHGMPDWQPLNMFRSTVPLPTRAFIPERRTGPLPEFSTRPLGQMTSSTATEPRKRGTPRPLRVRFRRQPEPLTTVLQVFLLLAIVLTGLNLANAMVHYSSVSTALPGLTAAPASTHGIMGLNDLLLFYATLGVSLALLIPYLLWVYQANTNIHGFSTIVRFTRGWAVGCNFVPALNLYAPCQVMQEIWKVSRNPRAWHQDRPSILVGIWWTLWLLLVCAGLGTAIVEADPETHASVATLALASLVLFAIQFVYYGVFFAMVTVIIQNQKRLVAASRRAREAASTRGSAPAPAP
jgi:hypothetical protein